MTRLILSHKSVIDLENILRYIARDKPHAAGKFVDAIERQCQTFVDFPNLGMMREDLAPVCDYSVSEVMESTIGACTTKFALNGYYMAP